MTIELYFGFCSDSAVYYFALTQVYESLQFRNTFSCKCSQLQLLKVIEIFSCLRTLGLIG